MNPVSNRWFTELGGAYLPKEWLHDFPSLIELEWLLEGDDADVVPGAGAAEAAVVLVLPLLGGVAELLGAVVVQDVVLARDHADTVRPERQCKFMVKSMPVPLNITVDQPGRSISFNLASQHPAAVMT